MQATFAMAKVLEALQTHPMPIDLENPNTCPAIPRCTRARAKGWCSITLPYESERYARATQAAPPAAPSPPAVRVDDDGITCERDEFAHDLSAWD